MPSPKRPIDWCSAIVTGTDLLCDKFAKFLDTSKNLCSFFTWMLNADGSLSAAFKQEFGTAGNLIGEFRMWPTSSIPAGHVVLNGQLLSRTDYSELFAVYGTQYGVGDGLTTFKLPDMQGRVFMGASGAHALGQVLGEETHQLTMSELPDSKSVWKVEGSGAGDLVGDDVLAGDVGTGPQTGTLTSGVAGSDEPHNNIQPSFVGYWITRAKTL